MDRNFLTLLGKMILFLASLTLLSPCKAHLPIRLMVVATKFAGNFLCRPPVRRWSSLVLLITVGAHYFCQFEKC